MAVATDPKRPVPLRVRHIDEIGRWGGAEDVADLRSALRDESPDIRRATMRAMMRLGPDAATRDLAALLQQGLKAQYEKSGTKMPDFPALPPMPGVDPDTGTGGANDPEPNFSGLEPGDMAWATRALGASKNATQVVPHLITALGSPDAIVRQSALAALQKASGLTMGAGRDFLVPQADEASRAKQIESWRSWWQENQRRSPEQWRRQALSSGIAKDRAAAALAIAKANQTDAVPDLIDAFRAEGNPLNPGATSAVREAMARALGDLTGVKPTYDPVRGRDVTAEDWVKQHVAAADRWKHHVDTVLIEGIGPFDALLAAPEAKSRAHALRQLRKYPYKDQRPAKYFELMERDESTQVQLEAYLTLVRATCVPLPFDPRAPEVIRGLQLARWRDWMEAFGSKRAEGAASIFLAAPNLKWGQDHVAPPDQRMEERNAFFRALPAIRARAAEMIAIERLQVSPVLLREVFEDQNRLLERVVTTPDAALPADVSSTLQRNLARLFGALNVPETGGMLVQRLTLYRMAQARPNLTTAARAAAANSDVAEACMEALGKLGAPEGSAGLPEAREMVSRQREPSLRVRIQSAYTLARLDAHADVGLLIEAMGDDPSPNVRIAAGEAASMLALKHSSIRSNVMNALLAGAVKGDASERLKSRYRELAAILEKAE